MLHDLFATAESTKDEPVTVTVPQLVSAAHTICESRRLEWTVAADGYLIATAQAENTEPHVVVTAWTGEGQGSRHGRPERWRQCYRRAFASEGSASKRVGELLEKHGGAHQDGRR